MEAYHTPVLLQESIDGLKINPAGTYVDCTFGGGGHSREILSRLGAKGRLVAFDQDAEALANRPDDNRLTLVHGNFKYLTNYLRFEGAPKLTAFWPTLAYRATTSTARHAVSRSASTARSI